MAHEEMVAQVPLPGKAGQRVTPYQDGSQAGERALPQLGKAVVQVGAGDKVEHGVAKELQSLVVFEEKLGMLVQIGAMGERALQQAFVAKNDAQFLFKFVDVSHGWFAEPEVPEGPKGPLAPVASQVLDFSFP